MSLGLHTRRWLIPALALIALLSLPLRYAGAQTAATLYTFSSGTQDWSRNFGAPSTSATLGNSGGALSITETSTAIGGSQAFTDGFNTIREGAPFSIGC